MVFTLGADLALHVPDPNDPSHIFLATYQVAEERVLLNSE